jgi:hypothetical protein
MNQFRGQRQRNRLYYIIGDGEFALLIECKRAFGKEKNNNFSLL